jgi:hypothetical protein
MKTVQEEVKKVTADVAEMKNGQEAIKTSQEE